MPSPPSAGACGPGVVCVLIALLGPSHPKLAAILLVVSGGLAGAGFTGAMISYVDIAPNFSGVTFAFGNLLGSFVSAFAPYAEGVFVDRKVGWACRIHFVAG